MRKFKIPLVILVLVVVLALLIGSRVTQKNDTQDNKKGGKNKTVPITVIIPKNGYFYSTLTVSGAVLPKDEVQITPKANGKLISLLVEEGTYVKAGQLIGIIDHSEIDTQIEQSEAKARIAKATLSMSVNGPLSPQIKQAQALINQQQSSLKQFEASRRNIEGDLSNYLVLLAKGIIPRQQVNNTQTQLEIINQQIKSSNQQIESSKQSLKLLTDGTRPEQIDINKGQVDSTLGEVKFYKSQLSNYNIISPLDGIITRKFLSSGSLVNQNTPIVTVSMSANPEIVINIPENEIENIRIGQKVEVKTSANSNKIYKGTIKEIYPNIDTQSRLGKVKAVLTSPNQLKLGMMLVCNIYTIEKNNTLTVPSDAIIKDNKNTFVYTVVDNKAVKKNVILGIEEPDETEIISGLKPNEKVILKGNTFVNSGSVVDIHSEFKAKK